MKSGAVYLLKRGLLELGLGICTVAASVAYAQAPLAETKTYTYEVASIKPNETGSGHTGIHRNPDRFSATNVPLKTLILMAYGLKTEDQIAAMPGWGSSAHFDIEAKVDAETTAALKAMPEEAKEKASDTMMEALLADRFQLKIHHETRELPIFALDVAKNGSKLKVADPEGKNNGSMQSHNTALTATGVPIAELCTFLSQRLHRKVEDRTGLTGTYDFTLEWAPDDATGDQPKDAAGNPLPSLLTAVQEQLGLRLESTRGPVDTIVVEHVAPPTVN